MRVTDGSGGAIYQPEGSAGVPPWSQRRGRGLVMARRERRPGLLDGFDGLLWAPDRRTLRKPNNARAPVVTTMIPNTIRNAAQRYSQVSSSSATKKKKKNVE